MINLQTGIPFQIEGELGKHNTLPIENLIEIGQNLQELVRQLAIANISDAEAIDLNQFKIELSDFRPGSAIPVFMLTPREFTGNLTGDVKKQKQIVNNAFVEIMQFS
ncbi:MAG: hypothetical protein IPH31_01390 [Lewinellaceae bacterium]|nr:hypothetical protein [Lewinellaceae bacterium]